DPSGSRPPRSCPVPIRRSSTACPWRHRPTGCAYESHCVIALSCVFRIPLRQCVVDRLEREAPLVRAACWLTVTTRAAGRPLPLQHLVEPSTAQRLVVRNRRKQRIAL